MGGRADTGTVKKGTGERLAINVDYRYVGITGNQLPGCIAFVKVDKRRTVFNFIPGTYF